MDEEHEVSEGTEILDEFFVIFDENSVILDENSEVCDEEKRMTVPPTTGDGMVEEEMMSVLWEMVDRMFLMEFYSILSAENPQITQKYV